MYVGDKLLEKASFWVPQKATVCNTGARALALKVDSGVWACPLIVLAHVPVDGVIGM
jgi:hypothetical protein